MIVRPLLIGLACLTALARATPTDAATTLDAIRNHGVLHCGGVPRPGLAMRGAGSRWSGLEVEICRAVAVAALGTGARFDFHGYESSKDFDRARTGNDDVSFVSPNEIDEQKLGASRRPGPSIFVEQQALMVATNSPFARPADLAGHAICFIIATASDNALDAWASDHAMLFIPNAFQETDEMVDAYNVQRCQAIVGETTELAAIRRDGGINRLESRLLPEALTSFPIIATTPRDRDTRWARMVAATIGTLRDLKAGRATSVDGYTEIFARTVGAQSPLRLDRRANGAP